MVINIGEDQAMAFNDEENLAGDEKIPRSCNRQVYAVEKILDCYIKKNGSKFYKVRWKDTWEPEHCVVSCARLLQEFWSGNDIKNRVVGCSDSKSIRSVASPPYVAESVGKVSSVPLSAACSTQTRRKGIPKKLACHDACSSPSDSQSIPDKPVSPESGLQSGPVGSAKSHAQNNAGVASPRLSPRESMRSIDSQQLCYSPGDTACSDEDSNNRELCSPPTTSQRKIRSESSDGQCSHTSSLCELILAKPLKRTQSRDLSTSSECSKTRAPATAADERSARSDASDRPDSLTEASADPERRAFSGKTHAVIKAEEVEADCSAEDVFSHEPDIGAEAPDMQLPSFFQRRDPKERGGWFSPDSLGHYTFKANENMHYYKARHFSDSPAPKAHAPILRTGENQISCHPLAKNHHATHDSVFMPSQQARHEDSQSVCTKRRRSLNDAAVATYPSPVTVRRGFPSSDADKSADFCLNGQCFSAPDVAICAKRKIQHFSDTFDEGPDMAPRLSTRHRAVRLLSADVDGSLQMTAKSGCKDGTSVSFLRRPFPGEKFADVDEVAVNSHEHISVNCRSSNCRIFDENMNEVPSLVEEYPVIIVPESEETSTVEAEIGLTGGLSRVHLHNSSPKPATSGFASVVIGSERVGSIAHRPSEKFLRIPGIPNVKSAESPSGRPHESNSRIPMVHAASQDWESAGKRIESTSAIHKRFEYRSSAKEGVSLDQDESDSRPDRVVLSSDSYHSSKDVFHMPREGRAVSSNGYHHVRDGLHVPRVGYRMAEDTYFGQREFSRVESDPIRVHKKALEHSNEEHYHRPVEIRLHTADGQASPKNLAHVPSSSHVTTSGSVSLRSDLPNHLAKSSSERTKENPISISERSSSSAPSVLHVSYVGSASHSHTDGKDLPVSEQASSRKGYVDAPIEGRQPPMYVNSYIYPAGSAPEGIVLYQNVAPPHLPSQVPHLPAAHVPRIDGAAVVPYRPSESTPMVLKVVKDSPNHSMSLFPIGGGPIYIQQSPKQPQTGVADQAGAEASDDSKMPRVKSTWPSATFEGESRPQCTECFQTFKKRAALERHMMIHRGIKPFQCHFCSQRFRQKHHLQGHIMLHTGERPHSCTLCNKRFRMRHHLLEHERISHKVFR